jgi:hypothetical protein
MTARATAIVALITQKGASEAEVRPFLEKGIEVGRA